MALPFRVAHHLRDTVIGRLGLTVVLLLPDHNVGYVEEISDVQEDLGVVVWTGLLKIYGGASKAQEIVGTFWTPLSEIRTGGFQKKEKKEK